MREQKSRFEEIEDRLEVIEKRLVVFDMPKPEPKEAVVGKEESEPKLGHPMFRNAPTSAPSEKGGSVEWPCEHIVMNCGDWSYRCGSNFVFNELNKTLKWDQCPIEGCHAKRPAPKTQRLAQILDETHRKTPHHELQKACKGENDAMWEYVAKASKSWFINLVKAQTQIKTSDCRFPLISRESLLKALEEEK